MRGRLRAEVSSASGSAVMATGIVSLALELDGRIALSRALLALAAAAWLASAALLVIRVAGEPAPPRPRRPALIALTAVAGTCVLGAGVSGVGWHRLALALLILGTVLWFALMPGVLAGFPWTPGGRSFLPAVATLAVAGLAADLAQHERARWMALAALVLLGLGIVLYPLALSRFPPSQLRTGGGEIWIAGGALAIGALACGELVRAIDALDAIRGARGARRP